MSGYGTGEGSAEGIRTPPARRRPWVAPLVIAGACVAFAGPMLASALSRSQPIEAFGGPMGGQAIAPGTQLQLQTSQGPMSLTVDSAMNAEGYVHAHGVKAGREYAGFIKLSPAAAQQQQLVQQPEYGYYGAQQQQQQQFVQQQEEPQQQQLAMSAQQAATQPEDGYYGAQQQQQQQQLAMSPEQAAPGGGETLSISRSGAVTINGEPVVAANTRTAAILRLLAKQASGIALSQRQVRVDGAARLNHELDRATQLVQREGRDQHAREHQGRREAMWAAMQSLMQSVDKIEKRQSVMNKTVQKVRRVMRYQP